MGNSFVSSQGPRLSELFSTLFTFVDDSLMSSFFVSFQTMYYFGRKVALVTFENFSSVECSVVMPETSFACQHCITFFTGITLTFILHHGDFWKITFSWGLILCARDSSLTEVMQSQLWAVLYQNPDQDLNKSRSVKLLWLSCPTKGVFAASTYHLHPQNKEDQCVYAVSIPGWGAQSCNSKANGLLPLPLLTNQQRVG